MYVDSVKQINEKNRIIDILVLIHTQNTTHALTPLKTHTSPATYDYGTTPLITGKSNVEGGGMQCMGHFKYIYDVCTHALT
jgi:hypothetical protein